MNPIHVSLQKYKSISLCCLNNNFRCLNNTTYISTTLFHLHVFSQHLDNITRITLPNRPWPEQHWISSYIYHKIQGGYCHFNRILLVIEVSFFVLFCFWFLLGSKELGTNVLELHFVMLANHDQNVLVLFRLAQSMYFYVKLELSYCRIYYVNLPGLIDQELDLIDWKSCRLFFLQNFQLSLSPFDV